VKLLDRSVLTESIEEMRRIIDDAAAHENVADVVGGDAAIFRCHRAVPLMPRVRVLFGDDELFLRLETSITNDSVRLYKSTVLGY